jgi:hypothetical protein
MPNKRGNMTYMVQVDDIVREATPEEVAEIEASQAAAVAAQEN